MMNPTTVNSFFSTTRTTPKYVINENKEHVTTPGGEVAIDYSPNTGNQLGILVEGESTNLFRDSTNFITCIKSDTVSISNTSIAGSDKSVSITPNDEGWIGDTVTSTDGFISVSFFVTQTNMQKPVMGYYNDEKASFCITIDGIDVNMSTVVSSIEGPMADMSYRVRARFVVSKNIPITVLIKKSKFHKNGISISNIQIESGVWTSYTPTSGITVTREGETIYRNLTHGVDINKDQGTFDISYSPTPGTKGSAFTALKSDWSEYIAFGHQLDDKNEPAAVRFFTSSSSMGVDRSYHHPSVVRPYTTIRASYSGYGVRTVIHGVPKIANLKDYDSFKNGKLNRIQFGESYDGEHFNGHIHFLNIYARTFNDEEILKIPFNDGLDPDYDLGGDVNSRMAALIFRTDEEAELYMGKEYETGTLSDILSTWHRGSNFEYTSDPNVTIGESNYWGYSDAKDIIYYNRNSHNSEMILTPDKFDRYEIETVIHSNGDPSTDNDAIGIVAASDVIDGKLTSIVVIAHTDGINANRGSNERVPRFSLYLLDSDHYSGQMWAKDGAHISVLDGNYALPSRSVWGNAQIKIKVIRDRNIISAYITNWYSSVYLEESKLEVDISTIQGKASQLTAPSRIGFMAMSQKMASFHKFKIWTHRRIGYPTAAERIVTSWPRVSKYTFINDPRDATGESEKWRYNRDTQAVTHTVNSYEFEMILSENRLTQYEFECKLSVDNTISGFSTDNDFIGIVLASNDINGSQVSLMAGIHTGGLNAKPGDRIPRFSVLLLDKDHNDYRYWSSNNGAKKVIVGNDFISTKSSWTGNSVKIKAIRSGDIINIWATDWNSNEYVDGSMLTLNIKDLPSNGKYLSFPSRYGFVNYSTSGATFTDYDIKSEQMVNDRDVYSEESNSYWRFEDNEKWVLNQNSGSSDILPFEKSTNLITNETYDINPTNIVFTTNSGIPYGEGTLNMASNSVVEFNVTDITTQFQYTSNLYVINAYDSNEFDVILNGNKVIVKSGTLNGSFMVLLSDSPREPGSSFTPFNKSIKAFRKINVTVS